MRTLRQKDLRTLVALLDSLYDVEADALPGRVAAGLHTIVPGVVASYNEFGPLGTTVAAAEPAEALDAQNEQAFVRFVAQHPVLARFRGVRSQPVRAISDYASSRQLQRLDLYQHVYRPLGIVDQISIAIPGPGSATIGVAMGRARRGFSQRERLLLELMRPHLAAGPVRAIQASQQREARTALEAAATAQCRAVIVLARNGRIGWATPPARRLLREWFAHDGGLTVPAQIEVWLAARRADAGRLIPTPASGPLRLEHANRALTVELLTGPELDGEALLTLNQRTVRGGQQLAALGLTLREAAVLTAAASGLGELGIGHELGISRRTVNKHLEHAYRKLDVSDRAHAIAAAFGVPERGARARPGVERREAM